MADGLLAGPSAGIRLALSATVLSGVVLAVQQRLNAGLANHLDEPIVASLVSLCSSLAVLALVVAARPASWRALRRLAHLAPVRWLGGLGGGAMVVAGAVAVPRVGVALLTIGVVCGQTIGGLLVDRLALGPGGGHRLTAPRLAGAVLCIGAVALGLGGGAAGHGDVLLLAGVVAAGFLAAGQQAFNGQVRERTGDAAVATGLNFAVGTIAVALVLLARARLDHVVVVSWPGPSQWYLYVGGVLGALVVGVAAIAVRPLGVLRLGLAVVAGQLVGAVLLDLVTPARGTSLHAATVAGAVLTLFACGVTGLRPASPSATDERAG